MTAWRACLGKIRRLETIKSYKVRMMRPDGSLILGRCQEPRELIQLPVDLREVDEYEKRIRLAERKPQAKRVVELVIEDNFDFHKYAGSWKK